MRRLSMWTGCAVLCAATTAQAQLNGGGLPGGGQNGGGNQGGGQFGGNGGGLGGGGAGGVFIDSAGVVRAGVVASLAPLAPKLPAAMLGKADSRRISLRGLNEQLTASLEKDPTGEALPEELQRLAGLFRIDYVLFDVDKDDVLLCGPAEEWVFLPDGRAVGKTSHRPALQLADLAVALRSVFAGTGEITCTIEATPKGQVAFRGFTPSSTSGAPAETAKLRKQIAELIGLQTVATSGVPAGSRFARALVDADFQMKRLAHGQGRFPGLISKLDETAASGSADGKNKLTRWWFTADYEGFRRNADGTAFQFVGRGMKLMSEEMTIQEDGGLAGDGWKENEFSRTFTALLPKLEIRYPAFADLHNLYDLTIAAGLIKNQRAPGWLAGSALLDETKYSVPSYPVPKFAEPLVQLKLASAGLFLAFGGVEMKPAPIVRDVKVQPGLNMPNSPAAPPHGWWSDGRSKLGSETARRRGKAE